MRYRHRVLGFLILLFAITYIDRVCISVAGPRMQEDLGIDPVGWGWVTAMFTLSYSLFEIPTWLMGDRLGPRRVLTRIVLWWSAFTSLTGMVSNYYLLLLTRFCFGAGEAGAFPNASIVVSRWFPPTQRARTSGVLLMASQIGGAIAPLLVVPIQIRYGWRVSFFVFGGVGVMWAGAWVRLVPSSEGDAANWVMSLQAGAWLSPARGSVPVAWGWNLHLFDVCPFVAAYYYDTGTPNDGLAAVTTPLGYAYPDLWGNDVWNGALDSTRALMASSA